MPNTILSPVMSMPVPVPGTDPGPQYAFDLNSCLSILDQHDHTTGLGSPITPSAMLINSNLPMGSNNITALLAAQFTPQVPATSLLGALSVSGVDLWYTDGSGNKIQITALGGVAGSPGSIANLVSPASASYVAGSKTFVWQSDVNQAANLDAGSIILRNIPGTNGLTLSPPALGSNYTITLPTLPGTPSFMTIDSSGTIGDAIPLSQGITTSNIANASITTPLIADASITLAKMTANSVDTPELLNNSVTPAKLSNANFFNSGGSGTVVTNSVSPVLVTPAVSITCSGIRPVLISITSSSGSSSGFLRILDSVNPPVGTFYITKDASVDLTKQEVSVAAVGFQLTVPASLTYIDLPTAGVHTYQVRANVTSPTTNFTLANIQITAYEL